MLSNLVFLDILDEVNVGRPSNQKIRQWFVGVIGMRFFEILKLHRDSHPESGKRRRMWLLAGAGWSIGLVIVLIVFIR